MPHTGINYRSIRDLRFVGVVLSPCLAFARCYPFTRELRPARSQMRCRFVAPDSVPFFPGSASYVPVAAAAVEVVVGIARRLSIAFAVSVSPKTV